MRLCLALCFAATLVGAVRADCDACLDGHCYKKHLLPGTSDRYGAVHRGTNTLYHYNKNGDFEETIVQCNLTTATCSDSAKISGMVDLTVDQRTGDVYGTYFTNVGIYKVDLVRNKKVLWVPVTEVWLLVFKDKLYYTDGFGGGIYVFENGVTTRLAGTAKYNNIKDLIVDRNNDIYFYNYKNNGRYLNKLSRGVIYESGFWDDHTFQMTVDKDDNAIFIDENTRAVYRLTDGQLVEIGAVGDWTNRPLFDRDNNMIYYIFNHNNEIKAWHFKRDRRVHCATSSLGRTRTIAETYVSEEDDNINDNTESGIDTSLQ